MSLGDQLRAVLNEEAEMRTATRPDVQGLINGGQTRRRRRNAVLAGAAILAAVIAGGGVYGLAQLGNDDEGSVRIANQPTPQSMPFAAESMAIEAGTYMVQADNVAVVAPYTITVPAGWETQHGTDVGKRADQAGAIGISTFALDKIRLTDDACTGPGTLGPPQTSAAGLVSGLRAQGSGPRVSDPVADTVGGLPATRIDLDYPARRALPNCRLSTTDGVVEPGVLQVWFGYLVLFPAESASVYVVDAGDREQVFVTRAADDATASDRADVQSMLDSISFQTGSE